MRKLLPILSFVAILISEGAVKADGPKCNQSTSCASGYTCCANIDNTFGCCPPAYSCCSPGSCCAHDQVCCKGTCCNAKCTKDGGCPSGFVADLKAIPTIKPVPKIKK